MHARCRGDADDDPTIIRHLHDLAALRHSVGVAPAFVRLVREALAADEGRGGESVPADPSVLFTGMLERLAGDPLWAEEYGHFVDAVSFAAPDQRIGFEEALVAARELVALMADGQSA